MPYQEILAGNSAVLIFPLSVLLVFLVLATLYESLTLPPSIVLIVPMRLLTAAESNRRAQAIAGGSEPPRHAPVA